MINWQPIETAPKDGEAILLYHGSCGVFCAYWVDGHQPVEKPCFVGGCSLLDPDDCDDEVGVCHRLNQGKLWETCDSGKKSDLYRSYRCAYAEGWKVQGAEAVLIPMGFTHWAEISLPKPQPKEKK